MTGIFATDTRPSPIKLTSETPRQRAEPRRLWSEPLESPQFDQRPQQCP